MQRAPARLAWRFAGLTAVILTAGLVLAVSPASTSAAPSGAGKIDAKVLQAVRANGSASYWILFRAHADLSAAPSMRDWNARGSFVLNALQSVANASQAGVRGYLRQHGTRFASFWIVNGIQATSGLAVLQAVAARPEVSAVVPDWSGRIPDDRATQNARVNAVEWNIANIQANKVWKQFNDRGQGVVVANIDTGVQYNHTALVKKYRGNLGNGQFDHNYNWFDPSHVCPNQTPCDNVAHGTHTMGTMVGSAKGARIGVAPKAKWIAAKGCESNSCSSSALLASGQWVLAPTDLNGNNPRADLRPDVVNNSWGTSNGSDTFYQATVQAWVASGIFPQFSAGNSGPSCGTVGAPGSYPESYAAGAYDINNNIASFSSRGPSPLGGGTKPNVSAPGVNVRSSVPTNSYAQFSGTSMASPHVAGTVALVWSHTPALRGDIAGTRTVLDNSATDTNNTQCGGNQQNNNVYGQGRLNALAAVQQAADLFAVRGPKVG